MFYKIKKKRTDFYSHLMAFPPVIFQNKLFKPKFPCSKKSLSQIKTLTGFIFQSFSCNFLLILKINTEFIHISIDSKKSCTTNNKFQSTFINLSLFKLLYINLLKNI